MISLTSHEPRFSTLGSTLKTLLTQDTHVDAVILWIAEGSYKNLPTDVKELEKSGLTVCERNDLKVYNKFIHTLIEFPTHAFVVCDDDTYYPADWISRLVAASLESDDVIPCHRAHRITMTGDHPASYSLWKHDISEPDTGPLIFPTGVGGILFKPGSLHPTACDSALALEACPKADDIWLYWMGRLAGKYYGKIPGHHQFRSWKGSQEVALWRSNNTGEMGNDLRLASMSAKFGVGVFNDD